MAFYPSVTHIPRSKFRMALALFQASNLPVLRNSAEPTLLLGAAVAAETGECGAERIPDPMADMH